VLLIYYEEDLSNLIKKKKKPKHDEFKNKYYLEKDEKAFTFVLLFHRQVYEYQLKLKRESEAKEKD
jgi:hypothetical protein